jgi:putative transposase
VVSILSLNERRNLIDWEEKPLTITEQAKLLNLNRTGLYYKAVGLTEEELKLRAEIDRLNTDHPYYGSRKIAAVLRKGGWTVSRKKVQRLMHEMGLVAVYPRKKKDLSSNMEEHRKFPYLLRGVSAEYPDHIWGTDITYVRLKGGWMYLTVILDWYSRYVLSWSLSETLAMEFVLEALDSAFEKGHPRIINSDQGIQYTSFAWRARIEAERKEIAISMDGRGRCMDNIFTERFWRTYKYEEVYLKEYESPRICRRETARYIEHYNNSRPHAALGDKTPAEVYAGREKIVLFVK